MNPLSVSPRGGKKREKGGRGKRKGERSNILSKPSRSGERKSLAAVGGSPAPKNGGGKGEKRKKRVEGGGKG